MRAVLSAADPVLARPMNSSIRLGGCPAAATIVGVSMSLAMMFPCACRPVTVNKAGLPRRSR